MKTDLRRTIVGLLAWFVVILSVIFALRHGAKATVFNKVPCTPLFVAGPQGRPLPDSVVSVTDVNGIAVTGGIYNDPTGLSPFGFVVPPNQIIQFYVNNAGVYQVGVTASGSSKSYWAICGYGLQSNLMSIDRRAQEMTPNTPMPPTLNVTTNGKPWTWIFNAGDFLTFDFVLPSFVTVFSSLRLGIVTDSIAATNCETDWIVNWCKYQNGDQTCDILTAANTSQQGILLGSTDDTRVDINFSSSVWLPVWNPSDHVIISIQYAQSSTCEAGILSNARLELAR